MSEGRAKELALRFLIPIFITVIVVVLSCSVLAKKVPETRFVQTTLESVENSKDTVMKFTGATLAASLAVSALPDDFATPLANNFADMSKYSVIILMALFVERLLLVTGIKMSFMYVLPAACVLFAAGYIFQKPAMKIFAKKIAIFGAALILAVPLSVTFTNHVGADYLTYVDEIIEETNGGADKINDELAEETEGTTIFEKLSDAFKNAIKGVSDLLSYFNDMVKKCMNAIVILLFTNFMMPIVTLLVLQWLMKEVFGIIVPTTQVVNIVKKKDNKKGSNKDNSTSEDEEIKA